MTFKQLTGALLAATCLTGFLAGCVKHDAERSTNGEIVRNEAIAIQQLNEYIEGMA